MNKSSLVLVALLTATSGLAMAGDPAALEKLDREWGSAKDSASIAHLLADGIISVDPGGLAGKAEMLEDFDANPPEGEYAADTFKTRFLTDDIAVQVHRVPGDDEHYSLHVWQKSGDAWQVVATASIPMADEG